MIDALPALLALYRITIRQEARSLGTSNIVDGQFVPDITYETTVIAQSPLTRLTGRGWAKEPTQALSMALTDAAGQAAALARYREGK